MKNNIWRIVITLVVLISGGKYGYDKFENRTDIDFVMIDPVTNDTIVYDANELQKHPDKIYNKRNINNIKSLTFHHTATDTLTSIDNIAKYHVEYNNWSGIGYHGVIKRDGTFVMTNTIETLSYHNRGENSTSIGIVFLGNYEKYDLTKEQIEMAKYVSKALDIVFDLEEIRAHKDVPGASTACCGKNAYVQLTNEGIFKNNK